MEDFPNEILIIILSNNFSKKDLANFSLMCKKFAIVAKKYLDILKLLTRPIINFILKEPLRKYRKNPQRLVPHISILRNYVKPRDYNSPNEDIFKEYNDNNLNIPCAESSMGLRTHSIILKKGYIELRDVLQRIYAKLKKEKSQIVDYNVIESIYAYDKNNKKIKLTILFNSMHPNVDDLFHTGFQILLDPLESTLITLVIPVDDIRIEIKAFYTLFEMKKFVVLYKLNFDNTKQAMYHDGIGFSC